jgi:precorrin-6B methylase 2
MRKLLITGMIGALLLWSLSGPAMAGKLIEQGVLYEVIFAAGRTVSPDVPYVPTPRGVVAAMLEMAAVDENDLLYDLGSGDGRIVITAAKERGARGVGIDIDPERIQESLRNAASANVSDRVEFLEQDLFETDLSRATVVTLYLLPSINLELRPKLLRELKPGTRVVSHAFAMGEWEPDQSVLVEGDRIFYWVIPANVSGTWEWRTADQDPEGHYRLELDQSFQEVRGILVGGNDSMPIENAELSGDRLSFTVVQNIKGRKVPVRYEGRAQGDTMEGRRIADTGQPESAAVWQAQRDPDTVAVLDGGSALILSRGNTDSLSLPAMPVG